MKTRPPAALPLLTCLVLLSACGGGSGGSTDNTPSPPSSPSPPATPAPPAPPASALTFSSLELAQTHVLPENGKRWTLAKASESLHFVGRRRTLALVGIVQSDASGPVIEGWVGGIKLGQLALDPPNRLPPTEAGGATYTSDQHSVTLPGDWLLPGLQLRVAASNYLPSTLRSVTVGADMPVTVRILPFYLFGADNADRPYAETAKPTAGTVNEMFEKWPVAALMVDTHPAQRVNWPRLVIGPSGSAPAYVMDSSEDQQASFQVLGAVLGTISRLMSANGDSAQAFQYYAPVIQQNAAGEFRSVGGGLGTIRGDTGAGDDAYRGIFIHAHGHAMGMPHAGEAFDKGAYPYDWGSLKGSAWGWDATRREFLAPFVPVTAERFSGCESDTFASHARAIDVQNRCVKQDPMQSGSGDQAEGYRFATFADYHSGMMQRHFEGLTSINEDGDHEYDGGYVVHDASFADRYKRWDGIDRRWINVTPTTTNNAQGGFNGGLPIQRDVPVHAIALTISRAGTAGATQIYPPLAFTGNLIRTVDPTDAAQRAEVRFYKSPFNGSGAGRWYCTNSGCDYTLRVQYTSGEVRHVMLQGAFRRFDDAGGAFLAESQNANHGDSFRHFVVNVPASAPLQRIELLDTPMVWDSGVPALPQTLASFTP